jgi:hypothetical protein
MICRHNVIVEFNNLSISILMIGASLLEKSNIYSSNAKAHVSNGHVCRIYIYLQITEGMHWEISDIHRFLIVTSNFCVYSRLEQPN